MTNYMKNLIYWCIVLTIASLGGLNIARNSRLTAFYPEKVIKDNSHANLEIYEVKEEKIREISAYNVGDPNQCAGDPCISANGENICNALDMGYRRCAANFVPFGTRLFIEEIGECLVVDRLNSRYPNRVDLAMKLDEKQRALNFGVQKLSVKILERVY